MGNTKSISMILFVLFIIAMLTSCASVAETTAKWKGVPVSKLIMEWGAPDKSVEYEGGKSHSYKSCNAHGGWCCNQSFQVDSNDIIVSYVERGSCL